MKIAVVACLCSLVLLVGPSATAQQNDKTAEYLLTEEMAKRRAPTHREGYEFLRKVGHAEGPFAETGAVEVNAAGFDQVTTLHFGSATHSSLGFDAGDQEIFLWIAHFINAKGDTIAMVHKCQAKDPYEEEDDDDWRPDEHRVLCEAAEHAISEGNTALLKALLAAGLEVNEPLDWDTRWTALHYAALREEHEIAQLLLDSGADRDVRSKYGERPINYAYDDKATVVCEVLRKPDEVEKMVGGYPMPLLEELFFFKGENSSKRLWFVSLNGKDPDADVLKFIRRYWPNTRPRSKSEELDRAATEMKKGETWYRDKETGEYGEIAELSIGETESSGKDVLQWKHRMASGPFLAGGGVGGKVTRKYGYWIKFAGYGWDE